MQILKKKIREKIIQAAEELFYEKGYSGTSMREIAKKVEISVSNLYKYYKNKNAIFEAVIIDFYRYFKDGFDILLDFGDRVGLKNKLPGLIFSKIYSRRRQFIIFMKGSENTVFDEHKRQIIRHFAHHLSRHYNGIAKNETIFLLISKSFFNNLTEIFEQNKEEKQIKQDIELLMEYHLFGMNSFITKESK